MLKSTLLHLQSYLLYLTPRLRTIELEAAQATCLGCLGHSGGSKVVEILCSSCQPLSLINPVE